MSKQPLHLYEFGPFHLNPGERLLLRKNQVVPLTPKVFDTLLVLVENHGHVLEKDDLMKTLWPDSFVEESSLAQNISLLRKALGEGNSERQYIETIPRRGYRFVAHVREVESENTDIIIERRTAARVIIEEEISDSDHNGFAKEDISKEDVRHNGRAAAQDEIINNAGKGKPAYLASIPHPSFLTRHQKPLTFAFAAFVVAVIALPFGLKEWFANNLFRNKATEHFTSISITKLTDAGKVKHLAISPDGKHVGYVLEGDGGQSLWVRQVASTSNVEILPPVEVDYDGLTFSRDGDFIYYITREIRGPIGILYRVPFLGGTPVKVKDDVDSPITFSPDNKQYAFIRGYPEQMELALIVADIDGDAERKLSARKQPDSYSFAGPSWSPDGKTIACAVSNSTPTDSNVLLVGIDVRSGVERPLSTQGWGWVSQLAWLGDGSGIIFPAWNQDTPVINDQIWFITYPEGAARKITNDLNSYQSVSVGADSNTLVTVQADRLANFWAVPNGDANRATKITHGAGDKLGEIYGMSVAPDGRIVYTSTVITATNIWIMEVDGSKRKQLTFDAPGNFHPAVSPDGRFIVFVSRRTGRRHIWRMDIDGSNLKQLTSGEAEITPSVSPDGKWVFYVSYFQGIPTLWRVSIDGGEPVQLTYEHTLRPAVSPDGKLIACLRIDKSSRRLKIVVIPSEGGEPLKFFEQVGAASNSPIRWSPDGRALTYIGTADGGSNIWSQPLDGSSPKPLTNFTADHIFRFDWSRDGKHFVCERGVNINDIVLIRDK